MGPKWQIYFLQSIQFDLTWRVLEASMELATCNVAPRYLVCAWGRLYTSVGGAEPEQCAPRCLECTWGSVFEYVCVCVCVCVCVYMLFIGVMCWNHVTTLCCPWQPSLFYHFTAIVSILSDNVFNFQIVTCFCTCKLILIYSFNLVHLNHIC